MYDLLGFLTEILLVMCQGYYLQWFYGKFMESRFVRYKRSRFLIMIIWIVARLALSYFWKTGYDTVEMEGKWIVTMAVLLLATFWLYKTDRKRKWYFSVTFFAVSEISFLMAHMMLELGQVIFPFLSWCLMEGHISSVDIFMTLTQISVSFLQLLLLTVYVFLLRSGLRSIVRAYREKEYEIHRTELAFILTPGLAGILICNLLRLLMITVEDKIPTTLYEKYPGMLLLVPAILVLSFLSIRYGVKVYQDMIILNREKSSRIILERQMGNIQEHIGEMERVYTNMRSIRHDMKNHLAVLTRLADQDSKGENTEIKEYLAEVEQTMEELELRFHTGSTVADTILTMKYHEAVRQLPDLEIETEQLVFPKELQIPNYDLAVILCNAIDNATEACFRQKDQGGRSWIKLSSMVRGKMFIMEISNSFDGQLRMGSHGEFPQTEKEDREAHGMGLYNIKNAVQKYDGAVDWMAEDQTFILTVMVKNEWKCEE